MLKRFSHFFASVLLVLIPLQGLAAANMSICNSMMQVQSTALKSNLLESANMPCHEHKASIAIEATSHDSPKHATQSDTTPCKTVCATLCANVNAMTVLPTDIKPASFLASSALISLPNQAYASITQPNLQRPPIFLA